MEVFLIERAMLLPGAILDDDIRTNYYVEARQGRKKDCAVSMSGAFGIVFQMYSKYDNNRKVCFRFWYNDNYMDVFPKVAEKVAYHLKLINMPYFTSYKFIPKAIRVDGKVLSGVKMGWVEGDTLDRYIKKNKNNKAILSQLAENFLTMCRDLHMARISHGDLANANIIVGCRGQLNLVDYDSLYVPGMSNTIPQTTAGQPAFQHPLRQHPALGKRLFIGPDDDNFSGQVIYLSLLAIAKDPSLVEKIGEEDLIFNALELSSVEYFRKSSVYQKLMYTGDPEIIGRLKELENAIAGPLSAVRSVVDYNNSAIPIIEPQKTNTTMAKYCHICGYRFGNKPEKYCPNCGTKRIPLK